MYLIQLPWDDFQKMMAIITAAFPTFKLDMSNQVAVKVWYDNLKDLDPKILAYAVKSIIATSEFPPSIATLRGKYCEINSPERVENEEGWGLVMRAIRNYGYMRATEALESLPTHVQRAVLFVGGFKAICESENQDVIRGQFNKAMASVNTRSKTESAMGVSLIEKISSIQSIAESKSRIEIAETVNKIENGSSRKEIAIRGIQSIREILNRTVEVNNG